MLNIHCGTQRFAEQIGNVFGAIYLLSVGVPLYGVFLLWFIMHVIRTPLRFIILPLFRYWGLRTFIITGSILYAGLFLIFNMIQGMNIWFFLFPFYFAVVDIFYWYPFHIYYALLGDAHLMGKQTGMRQVLIELLGIIAPLLSGWLIFHYGFYSTFFCATFLFILSIFPLFLIKNIHIQKNISLKQAVKTVNKRGFFVYGSRSIIYQFFEYSWTIVLFFLLGNIISTGGILSLAIFFKTIIYFLVSHSIDIGKHKYTTFFGAILTIIAIIGKVFLGYTIPVIIIFDIIFMFASSLFFPHVDVINYNTLKKSAYPAWFQFFSEIGWEIAGAIACGIMGIYTYFGGELRYIMLLAIIGVPLLFFFISESHKKT